MNNRKEVHIEVTLSRFYIYIYIYLQGLGALCFSHIHLIWEALVYLPESQSWEEGCKPSHGLDHVSLKPY